MRILSAGRNARLATLTVVCALVLGGLVILAGDGDDRADTAPSTTSTSTPPPVFGPEPAGGAGAVRTAGGLVLPIVGGEAGAWEVRTPCARTAVVDGERIAGAHVVLDPGHGGEETGAVADNGLTEAALNLDIARRVAERLRARGGTVVLTRDDDVRVTLQTRAALADALTPALLVSIHHNGGPTTPGDLPGTEVYHQHDTPEAARAAGLVFEALERELAPFSTTWSVGNFRGIRARLDGDAGDDYYGVLRRPAAPAVLIEALYLSSEPEATLLTRPDVRAAEARAIADAVIAWVERARTPVDPLPPLVSDEPAGGGGGADGCVDPPELSAG